MVIVEQAKRALVVAAALMVAAACGGSVAPGLPDVLVPSGAAVLSVHHTADEANYIVELDTEVTMIQLNAPLAWSPSPERWGRPEIVSLRAAIVDSLSDGCRIAQPVPLVKTCRYSFDDREIQVGVRRIEVTPRTETVLLVLGDGPAAEQALRGTLLATAITGAVE